MLYPNVAEGLHRIEDSYTNWYLIEDDDRLTVVDAGVPSSWSSLLEALKHLGRSPADVEAVVLTHAHFDHVGFAERARRELCIPVYVHENDVPLTRHPWLPVPGSPRVVFAPGHTTGHCALHLPDRDVLLAGDAVVTLDPYTARRGPRLVARAATADTERNLRSLDALVGTGARTVLVGHGEPWTQGIEAAVAKARQRGAA
jgi:glyoxylase-like metal-dependent hydrolase (beta-lactamase superfamily II)